MNRFHNLFLITITSMSLISPHALADKASAPFRHFVSFEFKEGTSEEKKSELIKAFLQLKNEIPEIIDLEWGGSENIEPLNNGFTHSFLVSFKDKKGLESYLPHEAHEAFVTKIKPHLENVFVFDYTAKQ